MSSLPRFSSKLGVKEQFEFFRIKVPKYTEAGTVVMIKMKDGRTYKIVVPPANVSWINRNLDKIKLRADSEKWRILKIKAPKVLDAKAEPIPEGEGVGSPMWEEDDEGVIYEAVICTDQSNVPEATAMSSEEPTAEAVGAAEEQGVVPAVAVPFTGGKKQIDL